MRTLENLELNIPHLSAKDAQGVFGGHGRCDFCGGYYCIHSDVGEWSPYSMDDNGHFWYDNMLIWDNNSDDSGYTFTPDPYNYGNDDGNDTNDNTGGYL